MNGDKTGYVQALPKPWLQALHLCTLSAFAVAQPLYDLLQRYPEFLIAHDTSPGSLFLLVGILSLGIPGLALALCRLAALFDTAVASAIFTAIFVILSLLFTIQVVKRLALSASVMLGLAMLAAILMTWLYLRLGPVRSFFSVLTPAILLFPCLFLLDGRISQLLSTEGPSGEPVPATGSAEAPVIMVVFDELPLNSLLNENQEIDRERFPNFAALADRSYWFRGATTVSEGTLISVPAILDGLYPAAESLKMPVLSDHPRNLFTVLAGRYRLFIEENGTRLRPGAGFEEEDLVETLTDLMGVYLHVVLPKAWAGRLLPPVSESWEGFWRESAADPAHTKAAASKQERPTWSDFEVDWREREARFAAFVDRLEGRNRTLFFLHSALPHASWKYLPSGKVYTLAEPPGVRGVVGPNNQGIDVNQWRSEEWPVIQAYQRHLLQVGFVDKLLGELMARLRELTIFDDCLLVVTADHGTSFRPGDSRRLVTETNYADIIYIPLLIKAPGQKEGFVSDRNVQTIDVLPTVAELLGLDLQFRVDGRSVVDPSTPLPKYKTVVADRGERFTFPASSDARGRALHRQLALFGSGSWDKVFRIGPHPEWIGKTLDELPLGSPSPSTARLEAAELFDNIDPDASFLLCNVQGTLAGTRTAGEPLGVSINGTLRALTHTFASPRGMQFSAVVPEHSFRRGQNTVEIFAIAGDPARLHPVQLSTRPQFELVQQDASESPALTRTSPEDEKTEIVLDPTRVEGWVVSILADEKIQIGGWARDKRDNQPAAWIVVFQDGQQVAATPPGRRRPEIAEQYGEALLNSGFLFEFPRERFKRLKETEIRVFAVSAEGAAAELHYPRNAEFWPFRSNRPVSVSESNPATATAEPGWPIELNFGRGGNSARFQVSGWSLPEQGFTWNDGDRAALKLSLPQHEGALRLQAQVRPFLAPPGLALQTVVVFVNDREMGRWELRNDRFEQVEIRVAAADLHLPGENTLSFVFSQSAVPSQVSDSTDLRKLAVAFARIRLLADKVSR